MAIAEGDSSQVQLQKRGEPNSIDDLAAELECELVLQGASAVEDQLQDDVPVTLAKLSSAGIKVFNIHTFM